MDDITFRTGPELTPAELRRLWDGALLIVTWSGGNGPHLYRLHRCYRCDPTDPDILAFSMNCGDEANLALNNVLLHAGEDHYLHSVRELKRVLS